MQKINQNYSICFIFVLTSKFNSFNKICTKTITSYLNSNYDSFKFECLQKH